MGFVLADERQEPAAPADANINLSRQPAEAPWDHDVGRDDRAVDRAEGDLDRRDYVLDELPVRQRFAAHANCCQVEPPR